jgi:hypothetical protein
MEDSRANMEGSRADADGARANIVTTFLFYNVLPSPEVFILNMVEKTLKLIFYVKRNVFLIKKLYLKPHIEYIYNTT